MAEPANDEELALLLGKTMPSCTRQEEGQLGSWLGALGPVASAVLCLPALLAH